MKFNTRIAPSPTGFFHLGTARVAYHNWLMARATGGQFLVRIDDTDDSRNKSDYVDLIYQSLDWLGIDFDSTFTQSSRFSHHKDVAQLLLDKGYAQRDGDAIRLKSDFVLSSWTDMNNDTVKISDKDIDFAKNQVLIKSDGNPIYHFASIVDDVDSNINLIMRGADHISNTSKQLFILKALSDIGYKDADMNQFYFCHVGLIMVQDLNTKKMVKLSKRDNRASLMHYKDTGYLPQSVLNAVLKLGWAHSDANFDRTNPLVDKDDAIKHILQGNFKSKNASFDLDKMNSLDKKYKNLTRKISP
jgi:glutamyl-tRNA synthetase